MIRHEAQPGLYQWALAITIGKGVPFPLTSVSIFPITL
jgi:hypothetical protein